MPRLFTGIEIPAEVGAELSLLRGGLGGARWIEPADYHLTLRFLGDISFAQAAEVDEALSGIRRAAFTVTLETLDVFGHDKPRAIVLRARASAPLVDLQAEQERLIRRTGLPPEPRKFSPHVTLARLRPSARRGLAEYLQARGFFAACAFEVERFVLYSARDSVGGGPYVVEATYPLF